MLVITVLAIAALVTAQGYLEMPLGRRTPDLSSSNSRLRPRQNSIVNSPIYQNSNKLEYIINVTIGTPGQTMGVTFDTGSSDLWVPSSQECKKTGCDLGSFNSANSKSSVLYDANGFNISYATPGDFDAGDWVQDSVSIGGANVITGQLFGLANNGYDRHGVAGFSFSALESSNPSPNGTYMTVLDNMVSQKIIDRKAYSLYLNSLNETVGSVIFAGIDQTKYSGELIALPLQPSPGTDNVQEFFVTMTSVTFTDAYGNVTVLSPAGYSQSVLLDSGTSDTILDGDIIAQMVLGLGGVDVGDSVYTVPCQYANTNASFAYQFGGENGPTVRVPVSELIGGQDSNECVLAVSPPIDGSCILGDSFLRSAYAVFDLDNKMAALAQAVYGKSGTSSIIAIPSGTAIPNASSTATASGTQLSGAAATSSPTIPTATLGRHSSIIAGTPTYNLGISATSGAVTSSSQNAAPIVTGGPQIVIMGAGILAALAW